MWCRGGSAVAGQRKGEAFCFLMQNFVDFPFPPVCPSLKPEEEDGMKYLKYVLQTPERKEIRSRDFLTEVKEPV